MTYKRNDYVIPYWFNRGSDRPPVTNLCRVTGQAEDTERGPYLRTLMQWHDHHGEEQWTEFWFYEDELGPAATPEEPKYVADDPVQLELFK